MNTRCIMLKRGTAERSVLLLIIIEGKGCVVRLLGCQIAGLVVIADDADGYYRYHYLYYYYYY